MLSESAIHVVTSSSGHKPRTVNSAANTAQYHYCHSTDLPLMISNQNSISTFFSREDLSLAKIIGQVDRKFIACTIAKSTSGNNAKLRNNNVNSGTSTLVLIDQHAADERVRVEGFLKELCLGFLSTSNKHIGAVCNIRIRSLAPPKPVLLTTHEFQFLDESLEAQELFRNWGVRFTNFPISGTRGDHSNDVNDLGMKQVLVETVPDVISDKVIDF